MIQPRQKLEEQWKKRNNEIQKIKGRKKNKNEHKTPELKQQERPEFTKQSEKTYITQLVEKTQRCRKRLRSTEKGARN